MQPTAVIAIGGNALMRAEEPPAAATECTHAAQQRFATVDDIQRQRCAGTVIARKLGAREIVDPRPFAVGIADTYRTYPHVGPLLPAPVVRARYELQEIGQPDLTFVLDQFLQRHSTAPAPRTGRAS